MLRYVRPGLAAIVSSAALLLAAGCSSDAPRSEVVAEAGTAVGVDPTPDARDAADAGPKCAVPDVPMPQWTPAQAEQDAKKAVSDVLDKRFPGAPGKSDPRRQLEEGFIGIAIDRPAHEYVAVVDPALVDVGNLETELKAAAQEEHDRRPRVRKVGIRAQAGCHAASKLIDALQRIPQIIRPHPGPIAWYPSAYDSRIHIDTDPAAPAATALRDQLGDLISFED